MAKIKAYDFERLPKPTVEAQLAEHGGFDPRTRKLVPMSARQLPMYQMLDNITAAIEAGMLDGEKWPIQLFKSDEDLKEFLDELADYDSSYRIADRWWHALAVKLQ